MRLVAEVVAVDYALTELQSRLTDLKVTLEDNIRYHNTEDDSDRRDTWAEMMRVTDTMRDGFYGARHAEDIARLVRLAAEIAR